MASWTQSDIDYLTAHYKTQDDWTVAKALNRTRAAVKQYRTKHGMAIVETKWTADEVAYLRENYLHMMDKEIAIVLHKSVGSISDKRKHMELTKREVFRPEPTEKSKPIPRDWKPSYIIVPADPDLIAAVDLQRLINGTYGRRSCLAR